jgi:hypothetical protein
MVGAQKRAVSLVIANQFDRLLLEGRRQGMIGRVTEPQRAAWFAEK